MHGKAACRVMLPDILGWARTIGLAIVAAGVAGLFAYLVGHQDGRQYERAAAVTAAFEALKQRGMINEEVRSLDDCALLAELGGVSDDCPDGGGGL